jgi:hypothetical protein
VVKITTTIALKNSTLLYIISISPSIRPLKISHI